MRDPEHQCHPCSKLKILIYSIPSPYHARTKSNQLDRRKTEKNRFRYGFISVQNLFLYFSTSL
jgi:hypothetical protein